MWRKGTLVPCWWECKLLQPLWKTVWRFLKKLKIELYDTAVPLLSIYPPKTKIVIRKDTGTPVFIAALFVIAKIWKQPKCPSTGEWINKAYTHTQTHTHTHTHTHNGILLSHKKELNLQEHGWTWRALYQVK